MAPGVRFAIASLVGLLAGGAVFVAFALYAWTAIHSDWSDTALGVLQAAHLIASPGAGILAGWWAYRSIGRGGRQGPRKGGML
jgi:hypothetical protein